MERRYLVATLALVATFAIFSREFRRQPRHARGTWSRWKNSGKFKFVLGFKFNAEVEFEAGK